MKDLQEVFDLIYEINEEAHGYSLDAWLRADAAQDDPVLEEELLDTASEEQAEHFRDLYDELPDEVVEDIIYWLQNDDGFREEFENFFGNFHFREVFGDML